MDKVWWDVVWMDRSMHAGSGHGWTLKVARCRGGPACGISLFYLLLAASCGPSTTLDRDPRVIDSGSRGGTDGAAGRGGAPGGGGTGGETDAGGTGGVAIDAPDDAGGDGLVPEDGPADDIASPVDGDEDLPAADAPPELPPPRPDMATGAPELARGRVGHWKLDEGRGNVGIDSSGIGNHGGTVNILGPDWVMGRIGTALTFTPDRRTFLIVASHPTLGPTEAISISVWVRPSSWAGTPRILQKGEDDIQYGLRAEAGQLRFVLRLDSGVAMVSGALPGTNEWSHIGASYDGRELRLYQDGSPVAMQTAIGRIASPFTALTIGARSQSAPTSDFFAGIIDDVIIYERALSAAEMRLLAEAKSP